MNSTLWDALVAANATIKTTNIKGKDYAEVPQRIKAFRMVYPEGFINTSLLADESGVCTIKAECGYYDAERGPIVLGTGHAQEKESSSYINKTSYIENCETSAVGRALGMAGFGIDVSVASAEEVQTAILNQSKLEDPKPDLDYTKEVTPKEYKAAKSKQTASDTKSEPKQQNQEPEDVPLATNEQMMAMFDLFEPGEIDAICKKFGVETTRQLTAKDAQRCINKKLKQLEAKAGDEA